MTETETLVDVARRRAAQQPDKIAFSFLGSDGATLAWTYAQLDERARAIAARLQRLGLEGQRAVVLFPPGLDYVAAFLGCLYAGVTAVPALPPPPRRPPTRLLGVLADARPGVAIGSVKIFAGLEQNADAPVQLRAVPRLATETVPLAEAEQWRPAPIGGQTLAFLQYTSGSTGTPRGVRLTHANLLANLAQIQGAFGLHAETPLVSWLPPYHDMGLIGCVLQPIYAGFSTLLMSPASFLQRPAVWLEAISRTRAFVSGGPNFAYELCARQVTAQQKASLDLSTWKVAFNGAEPVRAQTLRAFADAFAPCGFDPSAFLPCYGLAEATLLVSGQRSKTGAREQRFAADALAQNRAVPSTEPAARALIGCGRPQDGLDVAVVEPATGRACRPGEVGEIWVAGASISAGYWEKPELNAAQFEARRADSPGARYLRTGDLGFFSEGELFVSGRLKDLIILAGENHYPHDIEQVASAAHPDLRGAGAAAFSIEAQGAERLVVVHEVNRHLTATAAEISQALSLAVRHALGLPVHAVALLRPGTLPKTSSGKVQRHACREGYLNGTLSLVASTVFPDGGAALAAPAAPVDRRETEAALAKIWAEVLGVADVRADESFFDLGGHSLLAAQVAARTRAVLNKDLPLQAFFDAPSLAELARVLDEAPAVKAGAQLARAPRGASLPTSFAQERLWFVHQLEPASSAYTIPGVVRLCGALNVAVLERALQQIVRRHEVLRTRFKVENGRPVQVVDPSLELPLRVLEVPGTAQAALARAMEEVRVPFELSEGPLVRATLLRYGEEQHLLAVAMHHIVSDGWSFGVLIRELTALYNAFVAGAAPQLPELSVQYADFAAWQRNALGTPELEEHLAYWQQQLSGALPVLELPADRPRPAVQTFTGGSVARTLSPELSAALHGLCRDEGCTLFVALLSAFQVLLQRQTGEQDLLIGTPMANRSHLELEGLLGNFLELLVLRGQVGPQLTGRALLAATRERVLGAFAHRQAPFEEIVRRVQPARDLSRTPLFQVMFNLVSVDVAEPELTGVEAELLDVAGAQGAMFDLTLYATERRGQVKLELVFNADLYDAARAQGWLDQLELLVQQLVASPEQPLARLSSLTPQARALLPDPAAKLPVAWDGPVAARLAAHAAREPERLAVQDDLEAWSYAALEEQSNRLAHALIAQGLKPGEVVAIYAHRSAALACALLGVGKAGGAFVVLDGAHPVARLLQCVQLAAPRLFVELSRAGALSPELERTLSERNVPRLRLGGLQACLADPLLAAQPKTPPAITVDPDALAYLAFTSGSTGTPNAIAGTHRPLSHFFRWEAERFGFSSEERFGVLSGLSHDPLLRDLFTPLWVGAQLHLPDGDRLAAPGYLSAWAQVRKISVLHVVPTLAQLLTRDAQPLPALRHVFFGGEPLTRQHVLRLSAAAPNATAVNFYGATETPQAVGYHVVERTPARDRLPVGRGVDGSQLLVLRDGALAAPGELGELHVRGPYLSRGYHLQPRLTAERFVANALGGAAPGDRLYRTGDLARYLPDGAVELSGRADRQVKIRGVRVELDEISGALERLPGVTAAAVLAVGQGQQERALVAYVVPAHTAVDAHALRGALSRELPAALVPSAFHLLSALPRTPNGKLDERALRALQPALAAGSSGGPPASEGERRLAVLWREVLGVAELGREDSFFQLGGHSLLGTQLISRIRDELGVELRLKELFESSTLAAMAAAVDRARLQAHAPTDTLPLLAPRPAERHAPFPLTDVQQAYWVGRAGTYELGNVGSHGYAELDVEGLDLPRFERALQAMISRHEAMRLVMLPDGTQQILPEVPAYRISVAELATCGEPERQARLAQLREQMSHQILDAARWPLFEIKASRLPQGRTRLHLSFDLLIADAWSFRLLAAELHRLYEAPQDRPPPAASFRDYVLHLPVLEETPLFRRAQAYWEERLPTLPNAPSLPLVKGAGEVAKPRFVRRSGRLVPEVWEALKARAAQAELTPSGLLLAAFSEVLARWSKEPRFCLNLTLFNRLPVHPEINEVVGDFTTVTLLEVDGSSARTFEARARNVQRRLFDDLDHRAYSGVKVLRALAKREGGAPRALMPVVFTSTLGLGKSNRQHKWSAFGELVYNISQTPQVWLDHQVHEVDGALTFNWDAVEELFPAGMLDEMFAAYNALVNALARTEQPWGQARPLALPEAHLRRRAEANATAWPQPRGLLQEAFERRAKEQPGVIAVEAADRQLSYGELEARANALTRALRDGGAQPNQLVAVVMEKGWEQVVGVLGVLKAGAAYLPLDPALPRERLLHLLSHSDVRQVVTQPHVDVQFAWPEAVRRHVVAADFDRAASAPLPVAQRPEDLAYVIYTSGSTGLPKGVMIDHLGALNTIEDLNQRLRVGPGDKTLALSSLSFDLSVYDVFGLLSAGGTVVFPDPSRAKEPLHWAELVRGKNVTVWNTVPTLMGLLTEAAGPAGAPSLRAVMLSGDWIPLKLPARVKQLAPSAQVLSLGGATEASIWSIAYEVDAVAPEWKSIPYGRPLRGQTFHVLDAELEEVPEGVPGKLYIGGVGVAKGYFRDEARTRASFLSHPRLGTLYSTGDLGRWQRDGTIEFLGREDAQVKVRGHRIELGELDAALAKHPALEAAVAALAGDPRGDRRIVVYAVAADSERNQGPSSVHPERPSTSLGVTGGRAGPRPDLRAYLRDKLPEYMLPSQVIWLQALPVTANGKIDRARLPAAAAAESQDADAAPPARAPADAVEQQLQALWSEVLGRPIGLQDNFFDHGGDSLVAARLALRVRAELGLELPLRWLFEAPTVEGIRARVAREAESAAAEALPPMKVAPQERHEPFALTEVQEAYWMGRSAAFELGRTATHVYLELEYSGLDVPGVQRAWQRLVERHEMLRMVVHRDGRQQILRSEDLPPYEIQLLDLRQTAAADAEQALEELRLRMAHQVHPADKWPLFEIRATHVPEGRTRLHLSFDLLVADAWSLRLVAVELARLYEHPETALPPIAASFRDYVVHTPVVEQTQLYRRAQAYWEERLPTLPPAPNLPLAKSPTEVKEPRFKRRSSTLPAPKWEAIKERAAALGLTSSGLLLAAWSEVLARWTQEPRFCLNLPLFNRLPVHPEINDVVGDFTTVTLLEVDAASAPTFEERAKRLQGRLFNDLDHRAYSGVKVLRKLAQRRGGPPRALMPVVFTSTLGLPQRRQSALLDQERVLFGISQTPQVWLDHQVFEAGGALVFNWDAIDELFPAGMLDDMLASYCALLERLAAGAQAWQQPVVVELPQAQQRRRTEANATAWDVPRGLLQAPFEAHARARPQAIAVEAVDRAVSYGELELRANALARALRDGGAQPNQLVAVVMEKGWEQVVAVLGILKSGAAYLPLDPALPKERLLQLLATSQAQQLVTQPSVEPRLEWPAAVKRHLVCAQLPAEVPPLPPAQTPEDLAYVLFTSGSTGVPKGAMVPHRGAYNTVTDINERFGVGPSDKAMALSSLSFDLSVYDLFGMLSAGGTLVMPDPAGVKDSQHWAARVRRHGVTVWNTVPTLMGLLTEIPAVEPFPSLRLVLLSGDWVPVKLPDRVRALAPSARVVSAGGPTETSIWSVAYPIGEVDPSWKSIPYGRPLRNQTLHVLDRDLEPCPEFVPGQLYIGGLGVGLGYFRDEERTRSSFLAHPKTGETLYRSGDLCRWLPDGNLEILGREDFQVKIRGNRVELGEIEAALARHPELHAAVVVATGDPKGDRRLVLYAVPKQPGPDGQGPELRAYLRERLPEYMVPSQVVWLKALPLNSNGKVDRGALRAAPPAPARQTAAVTHAPGDDLEKKLVAIWSEILARTDIGVRDNFFDLGGSSVQLIQVLARMRDSVPDQVSAIDLFESPTISAMAQLLRRRGAKPAQESRAAAVDAGKARLRQRLQQNRKDGAKG